MSDLIIPLVCYVIGLIITYLYFFKNTTILKLNRFEYIANMFMCLAPTGFLFDWIHRELGFDVIGFIRSIQLDGKLLANIILGIVGVTAIRITQTGKPETQKWASVLGLVGQPAWFYVAWSDQNWGIFVLCLFYTEAWLRGFKKHWLTKPIITSTPIKEELSTGKASSSTLPKLPTITKYEE